MRHLNLSQFDMREQLAPPGLCLGLGLLLQLQRPLRRTASSQDSRQGESPARETGSIDLDQKRMPQKEHKLNLCAAKLL